MSHHKVRLDDAAIKIPDGHLFKKLPMSLAGVGIALILATMALGGDSGWQKSYLFGFMTFLSLALGGLFFVLVQHVTRAGWSVTVRRISEHVMATLPVFVLLFIPIVIGFSDLFVWSHEEVVANDPLLQHKQKYLNTTFFFIRAVIYFGSWTLLAVYFHRKSVEQDDSGDHQITRVLQRRAAPGIVVFALTSTFAAFDWMMSLDPHWFSTMWGVYFFANSLVGIFALLILLSMALKKAGFIGEAINNEHFHDLGKFLFAFIVFWTYIAFSQYMLYWYANIPEETGWFRARWHNGWDIFSIILAVGHFVVPFFFLMSRHIKRMPKLIIAGSIWCLLMVTLDIWWIIMPSGAHGEHVPTPHFAITDITAFVGVGSVFLATFFYLLGKSKLVPVKDPRLDQSLAFENY